MNQFHLNDGREGPDPKRLLLAILATSAVLMLYSYFFSPTKIEKTEISKVSNQQNPKDTLEELDDSPKKLFGQATKDDLDVTIEKFVKISTVEQSKNYRCSYEAKVSNLGGIIESFTLSDFSQKKVLFDSNDPNSFLLALSSKNNNISLQRNAKYEILSKDEDHINLRFITKEGLSIIRRYQFLDDATIKENITIRNVSQNPLKTELVLEISSPGNKTKDGSFFSPQVQTKSIVSKSGSDYKKYPYKDMLTPKIISNISYLGLDDQYFLSAFIPNYSDDIDHAKLYVKEIEKDIKEVARIDVHLKPFILMNGEEKILDHKLFLGPKQIDLLASLTPPLEENVEFGWFSVLCRPMLWLLLKINDFVKNFGLAIILITILIKLLTYPLTHKSYTSQQDMKKLAPKIKELQKKYSHDRTLLGQKQMELYREQGINPMAGCLPLLIQLPIWFAFYRMLGFSVELFDQPFYGWIHDLSLPDPYYALPSLMGISMLVSQALMPPQMDQPQMKYVLWAMPVFFTFIMLNMPAGLSLYILTNNLLTIIQQIIIKKKTNILAI